MKNGTCRREFKVKLLSVKCYKRGTNTCLQVGSSQRRGRAPEPGRLLWAPQRPPRARGDDLPRGCPQLCHLGIYSVTDGSSRTVLCPQSSGGKRKPKNQTRSRLNIRKRGKVQARFCRKRDNCICWVERPHSSSYFRETFSL